MLPPYQRFVDESESEGASKNVISKTMSPEAISKCSIGLKIKAE
jgi:hypothetical protein